MRKIIGTKLAKENATVVTESNGVVVVTWEESRETVKFENEASFQAWASNNRYIKELI